MQKFGQGVGENDRRMTAQRCAYLGLIAVVNKIDEAWIALFPLIPMVYAVTYFPNISRKLAKIIGPRQFQRLRDSKPTVSQA